MHLSYELKRNALLSHCFCAIIDCDILRQHVPQSCQCPLAKPKPTILIGLCAIIAKKSPWLEIEAFEARMK